MFNSVRLFEVDQYVYRLLWRDMRCEKPAEHYTLTALLFGDRPHEATAMLAMRQTVEMMREKKS